MNIKHKLLIVYAVNKIIVHMSHESVFPGKKNKVVRSLPGMLYPGN
ncbi:hypothetical protein SAMN04488122_5543 [Chitinophaga arvensicola]|uniref:Uncharacterized protein n=1 Tax=Chitinophaga arvensicola TaxID=29529 RepID=A0A1I0SAG1_9BACT|nr:hypothetical protein SAMN04488122_5543 [Chitinophaga arvensicola]